MMFDVDLEYKKGVPGLYINYITVNIHCDGGRYKALPAHGSSSTLIFLSQSASINS